MTPVMESGMENGRGKNGWEAERNRNQTQGKSEGRSKTGEKLIGKTRNKWER